MVSSLLDFGVSTDPADSTETIALQHFGRAGWALGHTAQLAKAGTQVSHLRTLLSQLRSTNSTLLTWQSACPQHIKRVTHDLCDHSCARGGARYPAAREQQIARILVGDDQVDVLEALRLLLKGAGYESVLVDSPQALLRAARAEPFDLILMDLNYARRHHVRRRRLGPVIQPRIPEEFRSDYCDDRVGQCGTCGGSHATGRLRLCAEALGQRAAAGHHSQTGRRSGRANESGSASPIGTGNRAQRPTKVVSRPDPPSSVHRLRRPVHPGARSQRRLLRFLGYRRQPALDSCWPMFPEKAWPPRC